jgi:hypothetical protein
MPFLQRRHATWYLRFRLPVRLQELGGRSELRVSLGTRELAVARLRAERVLLDVHSLKQLARYMSAVALEPMHVRAALDLALSRIAEELRRTREPWIRGPNESARALLHGSGKFLANEGITKLVTPGMLQELELLSLRRAIENGDHRRGAGRARELLREIGAPPDERSPHFRELAIEVLKLDAMYLEAQKARAEGDYGREEEFLGYYRRTLLPREPDAGSVAEPTGPRVASPKDSREPIRPSASRSTPRVRVTRPSRKRISLRCSIVKTTHGTDTQKRGVSGRHAARGGYHPRSRVDR